MPRYILVVDDDPDIRHILRERLESYGYRVEIAADGPAAIEQLERLTLSGIFLDIRMPGIDGIQVLARIRDRSLTLPVIIVTAAGTAELANASIQAGAQACLFKPFDQAQIKYVVERWFSPPLDQGTGM
ncbi:MAG: response regulator [Nitrospira sp.]|nr:response regulator [Nitrospira sp.]